MKQAMLVLTIVAILVALSGCQPVLLEETYQHPFVNGGDYGGTGLMPPPGQTKQEQPWWQFAWLKKEQPKENQLPPLPPYKPGIQPVQMKDLYPTYNLPDK